MFLALVDPD